MNSTQKKLDYGDAVAEWFLELAEAYSAPSDMNVALQYVHIAATILCRQSRTLSSPRLESSLRSIANKLTLQEPATQRPVDPIKPTCLHVIDEALPAGGLTAMAVNWMRNDPTRVHSAILLSQTIPVPEALSGAVQEARGNLYIADPSDSLVNRALWLRSIARSTADLVVLHVSVADVIAGAAFGASGGPPIIMVNHAAHVFWSGASIPDLVANCRGSELEETWTRDYRGLKCAAVPIPLNDVSTPKYPECHALKASLGIAPDAVVVLSVGAQFKYSPIDNADFLQVLEGVLADVPEAVLLIVGFKGDSRWTQASLRVGSRIRTCGVLSQAELAKISQLADVYVEGFPFGSTTAFLEASLRGAAAVLPPAVCPPPHTTDGVAIDGILQRATSLEEYRSHIVNLCRNVTQRRLYGDNVRDSVRRHHTGPGWRKHLESAVAMLPASHVACTNIAPVRTPEAIHERWLIFTEAGGSLYEEILEGAVMRALAIGLRPRLTPTIRIACREHHVLRAGHAIPLPVLEGLCSILMPVLPLRWASLAFRISSFLFRKKPVSRLLRLASRQSRARSWYEDYRRAGS